MRVPWDIMPESDHEQRFRGTNGHNIVISHVSTKIHDSMIKNAKGYNKARTSLGTKGHNKTWTSLGTKGHNKPRALLYTKAISRQKDTT